MSKYYAVVVDYPYEVAIFTNADKCRQWVHHQDEISLAFEMTEPDRRWVSHEQAVELIGDVIDDESKYLPDPLLDYIEWAQSETASIDFQDYINHRAPTAYDILGMKM